MSKDKKSEEDRKLIEEWLKNNEVTICPPEETTPDDELVYKYKVGKDHENGLESWLNRLKELLESKDSNALDFVENFKLNL